MGIEVDSLKTLTGAWSVEARRCDSCKTVAAATFCRADSAFLCLSCDTRFHHVGNNIKHEHVWMCEVCEQAPAAVTCKADAAALCVTCDADIHSANPLAQRHERVPVEPFYDSAESIVKSSPFSFLVSSQQQDWMLPAQQHHHHHHHHHHHKVEIENQPQVKAGDHIFFGEIDPFIDFDQYPGSIDARFHHGQQQNQSGAGTDSVVPVQSSKAATIPVMSNQENCFDIDYCRSKLSSFNYPSQSLSQSVSSSSLDVGVVPDGNSMSDISYPFVQNMNGNTDSGLPIAANSANQATQLCGIDREARVLRYREKRKNRKFEKTIRYASRKAYAETRPRIKGRFAKRTETDSDMDRLYNPASVPFMVADNHYGVVPSF